MARRNVFGEREFLYTRAVTGTLTGPHTVSTYQATMINQSESWHCLDNAVVEIGNPYGITNSDCFARLDSTTRVISNGGPSGSNCYSPSLHTFVIVYT
jgi:hypothetical protein